MAGPAAAAMGVEAGGRVVPGAVRIPPVEAGLPAAVDVGRRVSAGEAGHAEPGASKVHAAGAARAVPALRARAAPALQPPDVRQLLSTLASDVLSSVFCLLAPIKESATER